MEIEKTRNRISKIAAVNGYSVVVLGGLCLAVSVCCFSIVDVLIGLAAVASGAAELTGRRRLKAGTPEARRWLAGSQLLLLGAIILYAGYQLLSFHPQEFLAQLPPDLQEQLISLVGRQRLEEIIARTCRTVYLSVIVATVLYQGGLCLYYTLATRKLFTQAPPSVGAASRSDHPQP